LLVTTSRTYRSQLRDQQAERTRQLIADAARARFAENGWSGTSVRAVAAAARVSEATVYATYGSKEGLARSLIESAEQSADVQRAIRELRDHDGAPAAQLGAFIAFDRRLFELSADVIRVVAEARRQHPELGVAYDYGRQRGETARSEVFAAWPDDAWRPGIDVTRALAVYAIVVSVESYEIAVTERGWSPDAIESWWRSTLSELLLA
jgi:AcrR family transcriptional regulator